MNNFVREPILPNEKVKNNKYQSSLERNLDSITNEEIRNIVKAETPDAHEPHLVGYHEKRLHILPITQRTYYGTWNSQNLNLESIDKNEGKCQLVFRSFEKIAIVGSSDDVCYPCGVCRQVMMELAPNIDVICAKDETRFEVYKISELLPHAFTPEDTDCTKPRT